MCIRDSILSKSASFGSNIVYTPYYEKWISMLDGSYSNMTITFQDQNYNLIPIQDSNMMVSLLIRQKSRSTKTIEQKITKSINLNKLQFNDESSENNIN